MRISKVHDKRSGNVADRARQSTPRLPAEAYFAAEDPERRIVALSPQALARRQR